MSVKLLNVKCDGLVSHPPLRCVCRIHIYLLLCVNFSVNHSIYFLGWEGGAEPSQASRQRAPRDSKLESNTNICFQFCNFALKKKSSLARIHPSAKLEKHDKMSAEQECFSVCQQKILQTLCTSP